MPEANTVEATATSSPDLTDALLRVDGLRVGFPGETPQEPVEVLRDVSFTVQRGQCQALVGESGCGKSMTALAILGLLPPGGRLSGGSVLLRHTPESDPVDLCGLGERGLQEIRGRRIAIIFQEPTSALNPVLTIGFQIGEALRLHQGLRGREARRAATELLERVAMPDAERRLRSYPHQLSGGQCQRAMIAIALACRPDLLIADEPTTALDVTVQAQILELLADLRRDLGLTVLLITHDLGVVAQTADRVAVMYTGRVVEEAPVVDFFDRPAHPYSQALLASVPRMDDRRLVEAIPGRVPEPGQLPGGCSFHPRCAAVLERCAKDDPGITEWNGRAVRCWLPVSEEVPISKEVGE